MLYKSILLIKIELNLEYKYIFHYGGNPIYYWDCRIDAICFLSSLVILFKRCTKLCQVTDISLMDIDFFSCSCFTYRYCQCSYIYILISILELQIRRCRKNELNCQIHLHYLESSLLAQFHTFMAHSTIFSRFWRFGGIHKKTKNALFH